MVMIKKNKESKWKLNFPDLSENIPLDIIGDKDQVIGRVTIPFKMLKKFLKGTVSLKYNVDEMGDGCKNLYFVIWNEHINLKNKK